MAPKKKKVTREPHTQLFNEVLEGMAYAKLSPNEWQFVMVLWRLTYGRKNMSHKESGKYTTWVNAEFHRRTGIARPNITRIKNNLLAKKVIIQKKGMIGFNKHFKRWDKQCYLCREHVISPGNSPGDNTLLSAQTTTVISTDNKKPHRAKSSAEVQRLKKERKKETISSDKNFDRFWGKYPKKRQKTTAKKAWENHYTKHRRFTLDQILATLDGYIKEDWVGREDRFIPHAASWLNKHPWEDLINKEVSEGLTYIEEMRLHEAKQSLIQANHKLGLPQFDQKHLKTHIKHLSDVIHKLEQKKENS